MALAVAGDDAVGVAVLDVPLGPVGVDVGQVGDGTLEDGSVHVAHHDVGDELGHGGAVHALSGGEGAVGLALDNAEVDHQVDGLSVGDLVHIGQVSRSLVRSAGADDHHAEEHDGGQSQAEDPLEVSHLEFLLLKFEFGGKLSVWLSPAPLASVGMIIHPGEIVKRFPPFVT